MQIFANSPIVLRPHLSISLPNINLIFICIRRKLTITFVIIDTILSNNSFILHRILIFLFFTYISTIFTLIITTKPAKVITPQPAQSLN